MNAAISDEKRAAAETFLSWVASAEFAELYSNALPGFFSLSNAEISLDNPLAQEFVSWRGECESTIRSSYQILDRNSEFPHETMLWNVNARILNGELTPKEAADIIQGDLEKWFEPQMQ